MTASAPALASTGRLSTYVEARAAQMIGDEARSARLFAMMAAADPADKTIARRAIGAAIQSGQAELAVKLARQLPATELPIDARLLLAADLLRQNKPKDAAALLERGATSTEAELFGPLLRAWQQTRQGRMDGVQTLSKLAPESPLGPIANEQKAAMLFALNRPELGLPVARQALLDASSSGRNTRLRLAFADSLARRKMLPEALSMLQGGDEALVIARARLGAGQPLAMAIETPAAGFSDVLLAMAADLSRDESRALPIALAQIARHANPGNSEAIILLALLMDSDGRPDDALALLRTIPAGDLFAGEALDVRTRILGDRGDHGRALGLARAAAATPSAGAKDFIRLANVLGEMDRHAEAAAAYGEAISRSAAGSSQPLWTLYLLRAASLEQAQRWTEAKADLEKGLKLEPDNPLLLNFLGYGKLERGEDLDSAESMIRKASSLRPDDASITDSLGWALYKRGQLAEAIETLSKAAAGDPSQPEIHEHLGDALYAAGRRIEARFAWQAALLVAEDKAKARLEKKMELGLTPATAAP